MLHFSSKALKALYALKKPITTAFVDAFPKSCGQTWPNSSSAFNSILLKAKLCEQMKS